MITMTSLDAQNQFGALIDAYQRQPVTVTRRCRPVAVVMSYEDYIQHQQTVPLEAAKLISQNQALRGEAAQYALQQQLASMSNQAAEEGLTDKQVMQMINDN